MDEKIKILLVEDNPGDARLIAEMLREANGRFVVQGPYSSLDHGVRRVRENGVDVVLLDLGLPDSQGLATFAAMYEAAPNVPIIVLTGLRDEEMALNAVKAGAQDYLFKGGTEGDLLAKAIRYAIERKNLDEELRRSEERYRTSAKLWLDTFNAIEDGVAIVDLECRIQQSNRAMSGLLGATADELAGRKCWEFFIESPDLGEDWPTARMKKSLRRETLDVRMDGRWFNVTADPILDPDGALTGSVYIVSDITRRMEADRERNLLASIVRHVPEAVCTTDPDGNIVSWNEGAERMLGYRRDEAMGRRITMIMNPERAEYELADFICVLGNEGPLTGRETVWLAKGGAPVPVEITGVALRDDDGSITGYAAIGRDISERKAAAREVEKRVEELERFYEMAVGRELRMKELKQEVERLKAELARYRREKGGAA